MQEFVKGQFKPYRALTKIHLGKAGTDVYKDDIIEFDGTTVKIAGSEFVDPGVRGGIKAGWFVPEADNISKYIAQRADIKLRPANAADRNATESVAFSELADEERVVGSLQQTADKRAATLPPQARQAAADDPQAQIAALLAQVQALQSQLQKSEAPAVTVTKFSDENLLSGFDDTSGQDAVPVSRIKTAAVQTFKADESSMSKAAQALQADGKPLNVEHLKVNPIRTAKSIRLSADSATGDVLESREALEIEDLLPDAVKGKPKGKSGVVNTEGEDKAPAAVVFITAPDGTKVAWNKGDHWRSRVKLATAKYGKDVEMLKAIAAVEDSGVRKELQKFIGE